MLFLSIFNIRKKKLLLVYLFLISDVSFAQKSNKKSYLDSAQENCISWYKKNIDPYIKKIKCILTSIKKDSKKNHNTSRKQSPGDLTVEGNLSVGGGGTIKGVFQAKSLKVVNGLMAHGPIALNPYGNYSMTIGSKENGKPIYIFTGDQSGIYLEGDTLSVKSSTIGQPIKGTNIPLVISSDGIIGTTYSTEKAKTNICYFGKGEFSLDCLQYFVPCYFHYKGETKAPRQWGFIAEDFVGTPFDECVVYDTEGTVFTIDWQKINTAAIFLLQRLYEEFSTMQKKIETLEERILFLERASRK